MMTNETEAPVTVFSDHAPEAVIWALEDQVEALEDQVDAKDKRIAELEAERDEQSDRIEELQQACEVVSSEFEGELWQSCRRILQDTEAEYQARIADLEANLATAVAELEREADNHEEDADYHDDNCNDPEKAFHRGQAQRLHTIIAELKGEDQ